MYVSFPPLKTRAEMGVDLSQNSVGKEFEETKQRYEGKDLSDCFAMLHVNMNKVNREIDQVKEEVTEVKKTMAGLQSFAEFTNDSLKEIHEKTVPTLENSFDDKIQGEKQERLKLEQWGRKWNVIIRGVEGTLKEHARETESKVRSFIKELLRLSPTFEDQVFKRCIDYMEGSRVKDQ